MRVRAAPQVVLVCALLLLWRACPELSTVRAATAEAGAGQQGGPIFPNDLFTKPDKYDIGELAAKAAEEYKRAQARVKELERGKRKAPIPAAGIAPPHPVLPPRFKAKGKATIEYDFDGVRELLAILHYDYPNRRSREDLYYIEPGRTTRYYTGIRDYHAGKNYMIFHRIRALPLPSPHGCMVVPTVGELLHPKHVSRKGTWMGAVNISVPVRRKNATTGASVQTNVVVPTNHWHVPWGDDDWSYFESQRARKPIRLERKGKNVDVVFLHFEAGDDTVSPDLFRPESVTGVKCTPIGSQHMAD